MEDSNGSGVRRDSGPFAITPEWVLDAEISDRAVRLYAVLGRYADTAGQAFPKRKLLAARLRCHVSTIDRASDELEEIGALTVERRWNPDGSPKSNLYTLHSVPLGISTGEERGSRTDAAQNENHERTRGSASHSKEVAAQETTPERGPRTVDRKPVSIPERELAIGVLDLWNQHAEQDLRSDDWLSKIIMRIREYPEATIADHDFVIRANLADPWWTGPSNPSVVYGSGAQFERSVMKARQKLTQGDADERLERIVAEATGRRSA